MNPRKNAIMVKSSNLISPPRVRTILSIALKRTRRLEIDSSSLIEPSGLSALQ
jgi:hypothetical protein